MISDLGPERHAVPLRDRILDSVLFVAQVASTKNVRPGDRRKIELDARHRYLNDVIFHAVADLAVNEIMNNIAIGED